MTLQNYGVGILGVMLITFVTIACVPKDKVIGTQGRPTLKSLKPRFSGPGDPYGGSMEPIIRVQFVQLTIPLRANLDQAWELVQADRLPESMICLYQANGIRLGILDASQLSRWTRAIGPVVATRTSQMVGSNQYAPVPPVAPTGQFQVKWEPQPGQSRSLVVNRGRLQFLAKLSGGDQDEIALLELVPYHSFGRRPTVIPDSQLHANLNGRRLDVLTLSVQLQPQEFLIMGLERPAAVDQGLMIDPLTGMLAEPPSKTAVEDLSPRIMADKPMTDRSTDDDQQPMSTGPQLEVIPMHLGRVFFTASHRGHLRVQRLVLVAVMRDQQVYQSPDDQWRQMRELQRR